MYNTTEKPDLRGVIPVFFVCDTSESMSWPEDGKKQTPIDALNAALEELLEEFKDICLNAGENVALGLISFSTRAEVLQPLTPVMQIHHMPELKASGITNYRAAFHTTRMEILQSFSNTDKLTFDAAYRPVIFFLTDGDPTDIKGEYLKDHSTWLAELNKLHNLDYLAPRVYVIAMREAVKNLAILEKIVTTKGIEIDPKKRVISIKQNIVESIHYIIPKLAQTLVAGTAQIYDENYTDNSITKLLNGFPNTKSFS